MKSEDFAQRLAIHPGTAELYAAHLNTGCWLSMPMYHIVFVEDDLELGQLIAEFLSRHDMSVHIEPQGDRALACIAAQQPIWYLLDILLPGVDGLTLCRDLRPTFEGAHYHADRVGQRYEPDPRARAGG